MYRPVGKRLFDIIASGIGLILLSPVMLVSAIVVRVALGSPILFRQQRPGKNGDPFTLLKFRTMRPPLASQQADKDRLTVAGRWMRELSLDELPELLNVLRGEMSIVGPRPLLMQYLTRYSAEQARRHEVRPGITGWAQIHGRNALPWEERFRHDVWYVDHHSFTLDLGIVAKTIVRIVSRDGISQPGHATAEEFKGEPT